MKAMVCERFGGPEVLALRDVPDPPPPGEGEIQVRIEARGVQYVDVLMLAGSRVPSRAPVHPRWRGGRHCCRRRAWRDRICRRRCGHEPPYAGRLRGVGQREGRALRPNPGRLQHGAGRCVPRRLHHRLPRAVATRAYAGRRVGADPWRAGGIGIAAIQVAKAFGAKVIATAGSDAKRAACLEEGADHRPLVNPRYLRNVRGLVTLRYRKRYAFLTRPCSDRDNASLRWKHGDACETPRRRLSCPDHGAEHRGGCRFAAHSRCGEAAGSRRTSRDGAWRPQRLDGAIPRARPCKPAGSRPRGASYRPVPGETRTAQGSVQHISARSSRVPEQLETAKLARARLAAWSGPKNLRFAEGVPGKVLRDGLCPRCPKMPITSPNCTATHRAAAAQAVPWCWCP